MLLRICDSPQKTLLLMISTKSPVRLRTKKMKDGGQSLYLDIYVDGQRTYEFLKLYLVQETDAESRRQNKRTLLLAESIQAKRLLDVQSGLFGLVNPALKNIRIRDFSERVLQAGDNRYATEIRRAVRRFVEYAGDVKIEKITSEMLEGYIKYLSQLKDSRTNKQEDAMLLARPSVLCMYNKLAYLLNLAAKKGVIAQSPTQWVVKPSIRPGMTKERNYLTVEELERFGQVQCKWTVVRDAFMFSCFTGLRISDILSLRWGEIVDGQIIKTQVKTGLPVYIPLSDNARKWLPAQGMKETKSFVFDLPCRKTIDNVIRSIAIKAKIDKDITFHCSRHTFATLMLTYGADIYTVSKLLGHSSIAVTSVYARVVDKKKREAVEAIPAI